MKTRSWIHGGLLVLVLFTILGLIAVSALAMTSAYSELKLARAAAGRTRQYYELERLAGEELQRANTLLKEAHDGGYVYDLLSPLEMLGWLAAESGPGWVLSRDVTVTDGEKEQSLRIELLAASPDENGRYYKILAWRQWQDSFEYETEGADIWQG